MSGILVSGLINIETTLRVEQFPVTYVPVRYPFWGVGSTVSGVGYNIARALVTLGDEVRLFSLVGKDLLGELVQLELNRNGVSAQTVLAMLPETAQSVILYDLQGQRQIHLDLKDVQEQPFPPERFAEGLAECDLVVLCNVNWNRPFLAQARQAGKLIATDVHTIGDLEDAYNGDFMAAAHILFMSDEQLPCAPEEWARRVQDRYGTPIIVIGLGREGALLALRGETAMVRVSAVYTRPVVNTIGAGDALFSAFVHEYARNKDPYAALEMAVVFASYKIGTAGAAQGFLTEAELAEWVQQVQGKD